MALRRPSQKMIDLYNQLISQQNITRKKLRIIHKKAEEANGAGRLPALVIPKSAHKIRKSNFYGLSKYELQRRLRAFYAKYKEAKRLFGKGLTSYIGRTVKDGYMELWRDQILFIGGESPEGVANMFTKEQIANSFMGEFMTVYNKLNRLSPEAFLALLYKGDIIQFKYIYQEMIGQGNKEYSWIDQQTDILKARGYKSQIEIFKNEFGIEPPIKHTKKTIAEAERRRAKDEDED